LKNEIYFIHITVVSISVILWIYISFINRYTNCPISRFYNMEIMKKDITKSPTLKENFDNFNNKTITIITNDLLYIKQLGYKVIFDDSLSPLSWPNGHHKEVVKGFNNKIFYLFSNDSLSDVTDRIEYFYTLYNKPNIGEAFKTLFDEVKQRKHK